MSLLINRCPVCKGNKVQIIKDRFLLILGIAVGSLWLVSSIANYFVLSSWMNGDPTVQMPLLYSTPIVIPIYSIVVGLPFFLLQVLLDRYYLQKRMCEDCGAIWRS